MALPNHRVEYWRIHNRVVGVAHSSLNEIEIRDILSFATDGELTIVESVSEIPEVGDVILRSDQVSVSEFAGTSIGPPVSRLVVNLTALAANVATLSKAAATPIVAMVKANAYGHGIIEVGAFVESLPDVTHLGVATCTEGINLRHAGVEKEILVTYPSADDLERIRGYDLTLAVGSIELLESLVAADSDQQVHFEVDSGFHRSGLRPEQIEAAVAIIADSKLQLKGIMTHLSCADEPDMEAHNELQLERFREAVSHVNSEELLVHSSNTAASVLWNPDGASPSRPGIGIYGLHPSPLTDDRLDLYPVSKVVSQVIQEIHVPGGEAVGYGATWRAPAGGARIGLVPVGYGDGLPRSLSNRHQVEVAGQTVAVVGRISMDSCTVDLSALPDGVGVGSEVLVVSDVPSASNSVDSIATQVGTINYEILTSLTSRLARCYRL